MSQPDEWTEVHRFVPVESWDYSEKDAELRRLNRLLPSTYRWVRVCDDGADGYYLLEWEHE